MSRKRVHKEEITDQESPKRLHTHVSTKAAEFGSFFMLPQTVITKILVKCNVSELTKLALVSKRCRDLVLSWLEEDTRLSIYPCLVSYNMKKNSTKYQINGGSKLYRLEPNRTRKNFHEVNIKLLITYSTCPIIIGT